MFYRHLLSDEIYSWIHFSLLQCFSIINIIHLKIINIKCYENNCFNSGTCIFSLVILKHSRRLHIIGWAYNISARSDLRRNVTRIQNGSISLLAMSVFCLFAISVNPLDRLETFDWVNNFIIYVANVLKRTEDVVTY